MNTYTDYSKHNNTIKIPQGSGTIPWTFVTDSNQDAVNRNSYFITSTSLDYLPYTRGVFPLAFYLQQTLQYIHSKSTDILQAQ